MAYEGWIDLRSDTVTRPTPAMRRAMYEAEVADDTYDGDPTVKRLQELAAEKTGTERALLVASGTMGNLLGFLVNTNAGQEAILGDISHQFLWEMAGFARVAQVAAHIVPFHNGWMDAGEIEAAVRLPFREATSTALVCVEDPTNTGGGLVISPEHLGKIYEVARRHNLRMHMDGARFFNAVVASRRPARDFTQYLDTMSFCLSKGLGCPFGAMFCGKDERVERALALRQMLGGGMRQAGIMAAAGIYALEHNIERMAEDHANAKRLAAGIVKLFGECLDPPQVETNMFFVDVAKLGVSGAQLSDHLKSQRILVFPGEKRVRFTTHLDVTSEDIDATLKALARLRRAA